MLNRRELLILGSAATAGVAPGVAAPAKKSLSPRRSAEIRALRAFAEQTHPRGREAAADGGWRKRWITLEAAADVLSDGAYFVGARHALAWFEDGHTTVLPFEFIGGVPERLRGGPFGLNLPWKVRVFDDGAYVTATTEAQRSILGAKVEGVGRMSTAELIRTLDETWPGNKAWAQNWSTYAFSSPAQLQGLGAIADPKAPLRIRLKQQGAATDLELAPQRQSFDNPIQVGRKKSEREEWAAAAKRGNYVKALPERQALYLSIDDMDDVEGATFEQFTREAFAAMDAAPQARVVLDLRRNGGGNNFFGEPLRKRIERSLYNRPGSLYVLIGPATFSAAQNLANRLERETFARFVGDPTGLAPNHYGDAKIFQGPATGITAMVSTLPWFDSYPQDKREWIMPDLPVPTTFEDWRNGRDPALDLALGHRQEAAADDLSADRVFYYRRASQKAEWKPFWR